MIVLIPVHNHLPVIPRQVELWVLQPAGFEEYVEMEVRDDMKLLSRPIHIRNMLFAIVEVALLTAIGSVLVQHFLCPIGIQISDAHRSATL